MKEAIVNKNLTVDIIDSEIPKPGPDQVLIKVVVSGCNPKDWKFPSMLDKEINQGDDIAGVVEAVGENVNEFKHGDRVAGLHEMGTAGGSYAEYAISWQHTCFHVPKRVTFEEAATLPLAAMTAAVGLYAELKLPSPWTPAAAPGQQQKKNKPIPFVIYGAASAVGAFAIQFAQKSNIHPIIAIAGRGEAFVETLIDRSKGDTIVDYRGGDDAVVQGIRNALKGEKLHYAYDAIGEHNSYVNIAKVLEPGPDVGHLTVVLPISKQKEVLEQFDTSMTYVGKVHIDENYKDFGFVYFRAMGFGLQQGWLKAHPQEVVNGGLAGVEGALGNLRDGKASAVKYVFRIAETPGIS